MLTNARTRVEIGDLRLQTAVRLRWFGVIGQVLTIAGVYFILGFSLPFGVCLGLVAVSAWLNVYLRIRYPARHRLSPAFATTLLAYDILQLGALLYMTGGINNPFAPLIVAPVTVSAATLPARNTVLLGVIAAAAVSALVFYHFPLPWFPGESMDLPKLYKAGVVASIGAGMVFLALYTWRLSQEARQMSAALAATEHVLAREQQLHALDGLAAAAAHELGTPLSTITVVAKELSRALPKDGPVADDLALLQSQALRCREILQKLTRAPDERDPLYATMTLSDLVREAADPHSVFKARVALDIGPEAGAAPASAEPVGERRPGVIFGLGNLIENAVDFAQARVDVTARWSAKTVTITVADDGPGFKPDVMDTLGDPYVTTRPARGGLAGREAPSGLGLGFFIAKTLLERSGAALTLENRVAPEHGAVVRISWPRAAFATEAGGWSPHPSEARRVGAAE